MDAKQIGPYRLDNLLGSGGMGEVYRAYDLVRERVVALKLLPEASAKDADYVQRFRRESRVVARLREPHVIPIHDFGELDGRLFIDMRFVDGQTIRELLAQHGAMTPAYAVHVIGQVAEALEAAHADGLVHRDIKPSNVLVTSSGFASVVDFGIARSLGTAPTMTGAAVGTLDYMAPERFTSKQVDGRTDVYSMACLLHECVTGVKPFVGTDLPALMFAHLYTAPPRPSIMAPAVPPAFDAVIATGMAKSADDRYPTPAALAEAARAALSDTAPRVPAYVDWQPAAQTEPVGETGAAAARAVVQSAALAVAQAAVQSADPLTVDSRVPLQAPPPDGPPGGPPGGTPPAGAAEPPAEPARAAQAGPTVSPETLPPPLPGLLVKPSRRRRTALVVAIGAALVGALVAVGIVQLRAPTETRVANSQADVVVPTQVPVAASIAVPTVVGTIPGGTTPGYLDVAPNGRYAYIANREAGYVTVLDMVINKVTATIPIPAGPPQFVTFAPDGKRAYISIFNADRSIALVGVLDTRTNTLLNTIPVGKRPFASATNADGTRLYVPSHDEGKLYVIDTTNNSVTAKIPVPPNPHWVAFSRNGERIYTANHESNVVSVLNAKDNSVIATIPVGTSPHSTTVSPDGTRVSVVNFDSSTVSIIDTASNTVVATVPVGARPQDVAYAPDGRYLYTANVDGNSVSVIDTTTNQVTATIPIGAGPTSIGVTPDGKRAYVTALNTGIIYILDIAAV